ncbi:hypothetical protein LOCC1_G006389 [Lachnellula occidentalis]|uniref:C2H2-type domain-containing protein n=1 Tax=Lachnellula occidentalis TaxID=215460 RepID=A0A8H8RPV8_9HELO|nr:hypothetical protein LOCC1_G006389 [Lachnellula occidentalis]
MQAQRHEDVAANQMDTQHHFSQPSYPDMGLGGLADAAPNLPNSTLNYENNCSQGIQGVSTTAVPSTNNISHDVAHQSNLPLPSGALLYAPTPDPIYHGYSSQDNGFLNVGDDSYGSLTSQYPAFASGHNVPVPTCAFATNVPTTAGVQMGFPFDQSITFNHPRSSLYCPLPWNAMGVMMPDALPIANPEAPGNHPSQRDAMDFSDTMLADFPVVPSFGSVNDNIAAHPPIPAAPPAAPPLAAPPLPITRIPCTFCTHTFVRDSDRIRHENSKHLNIPGAHLCPVPRCSKSHGRGFSRADKLTEHLWKKHAGLGYAKRV